MAPSYKYRATPGSNGTMYNYDIGEGSPNFDPYVYLNGTLINKLGIQDSEALFKDF